MPAASLFLLLALSAPLVTAQAADDRRPNRHPAKGAAGPANALHDLRWIGFQAMNDSVRVFIRTDVRVPYKIDRVGEDHIRLILESTGVSLPLHLRPLDTTFFNGPIEWIEVRRLAAPTDSVVVDITLRAPATFTPTQKDQLIALDFPIAESAAPTAADGDPEKEPTAP